MAKVFFRDSTLQTPRDCVATGPDTLGIHGHGIGGETGKRHHGPYKPRINYQVMGAGQGGQSRSGAGRGTGGQRDGPSQPAQPHRNQRISYQRTDPTPRVLTPPLSWRGHCAGENTPCRKIYAKMFLEKQMALIFSRAVLSSIYEKQTL